MGLILNSLFPKEEEDVSAMPDPGKGIDNLLEKYQFAKQLFDEGAGGADTKNAALGQGQALDPEAVSKGLIGRAMYSYPADANDPPAQEGAAAGSVPPDEASDGARDAPVPAPELQAPQENDGVHFSDAHFEADRPGNGNGNAAPDSQPQGAAQVERAAKSKLDELKPLVQSRTRAARAALETPAPAPSAPQKNNSVHFSDAHFEADRPRSSGGVLDSLRQGAEQAEGAIASGWDELKHLVQSRTRPAGSSKQNETAGDTGLGDRIVRELQTLKTGAADMLDKASHYFDKSQTDAGTGNAANVATNQAAGSPASAPASQAPNQFPGFDLGTKGGIQSFLNDMSRRVKAKEGVSDEELGMAKTLLSTYFGINRNTEGALKAWPPKEADRRFDRTADALLLPSRWAEAKGYLADAAKTVGVDPGILSKIANFESAGFHADARPISLTAKENKQRQFDGVMATSTAHGYGQFIDSSWTAALRKNGAKYGVADAASLDDKKAAAYRTDKKLQALMLAEFTKDNIKTGRALGGSDDDANVYALHNLGEPLGKEFLKALKADPDQKVSPVLSKAVIKNNSGLYGDGNISVQEAYERMGAAMRLGDQFADEIRR